MARRNGPVFLERRSYRARRIVDAVRLLPILGIGLWMLPLLWSSPQSPQEVTTLSQALRYVFAVWAGLILVCFWLSALTRRYSDPEPRLPDTND